MEKFLYYLFKNDVYNLVGIDFKKAVQELHTLKNSNCFLCLGPETNRSCMALSGGESRGCILASE